MLLLHSLAYLIIFFLYFFIINYKIIYEEICGVCVCSSTVNNRSLPGRTAATSTICALINSMNM